MLTAERKANVKKYELEILILKEQRQEGAEVTAVISIEEQQTRPISLNLKRLGS